MLTKEIQDAVVEGVSKELLKFINEHMICKNCKWWEYCDGGNCGNEEVNEMCEARGRVIDAYFLPPQNFGCNQWKEKK